MTGKRKDKFAPPIEVWLPTSISGYSNTICKELADLHQMWVNLNSPLQDPMNIASQVAQDTGGVSPAGDLTVNVQEFQLRLCKHACQLLCQGGAHSDKGGDTRISQIVISARGEIARLCKGFCDFQGELLIISAKTLSQSRMGRSFVDPVFLEMEEPQEMVHVETAQVPEAMEYWYSKGEEDTIFSIIIGSQGMDVYDNGVQLKRKSLFGRDPPQLLVCKTEERTVSFGLGSVNLGKVVRYLEQEKIPEHPPFGPVLGGGAQPTETLLKVGAERAAGMTLNHATRRADLGARLMVTLADSGQAQTVPGLSVSCQDVARALAPPHANRLAIGAGCAPLCSLVGVSLAFRLLPLLLPPNAPDYVGLHPVWLFCAKFAIGTVVTLLAGVEQTITGRRKGGSKIFSTINTGARSSADTPVIIHDFLTGKVGRALDLHSADITSRVRDSAPLKRLLSTYLVPACRALLSVIEQPQVFAEITDFFRQSFHVPGGLNADVELFNVWRNRGDELRVVGHVDFGDLGKRTEVELTEDSSTGTVGEQLRNQLGQTWATWTSACATARDDFEEAPYCIRDNPFERTKFPAEWISDTMKDLKDVGCPPFKVGYGGNLMRMLDGTGTGWQGLSCVDRDDHVVTDVHLISTVTNVLVLGKVVKGY